jgi:hypothetical protein
LELTENFFKTQKQKKKFQPLIFRARAFARAAKKNVVFAIYATYMGASTEEGV